MATSSSTDFEPNVAEFVEEAFERCGLELRTGYDLKTARRSINLMFINANHIIAQLVFHNHSTNNLYLGGPC